MTDWKAVSKGSTRGYPTIELEKIVPVLEHWSVRSSRCALPIPQGSNRRGHRNDDLRSRRRIAGAKILVA